MKNGIPSHDTLCCVFGMISPDLQQFYQKWQVVTIDAMGTQTAIAEKIRNYQTEGTGWLTQKKEYRYYISSL